MLISTFLTLINLSLTKILPKTPPECPINLHDPAVPLVDLVLVAHPRSVPHKRTCTISIGRARWLVCLYGIKRLHNFQNQYVTGIHGYTLLLSGILEYCFLGLPHASSLLARNWSIYQQIERKLASEAANHASVTPQGMWCALPLLHPISALLRVHVELLYI